MKKLKPLCLQDMIPQHQELIANEYRENICATHTLSFTLLLQIGNLYKALSFALSFITEHNEVKAKCLTEIQNVCMSNGQLDISSENIKRLTYLEACIKETLRLRELFHKSNLSVVNHHCRKNRF